MEDDTYNFNGMDDDLIEICKAPIKKDEEEFWESI